MAADKNDSGYVVKGSLIQVKDGDFVRFLHHGVTVPGYVDADELKRLEDLELIEKASKSDAVPATLPRAVDL